MKRREVRKWDKMAEDWVLSRHLAEAKREEEAKKMREMGKKAGT